MWPVHGSHTGRCGWCVVYTDIGPTVAASLHTTAPVNHTRPSPHKQSPDVTTPSEMAEPDYCLLLIYGPRKDERLSWPGWLTCSGWLTHISGYPAATDRAQDREVRRPKDQRSTTIPRNHMEEILLFNTFSRLSIYTQLNSVLLTKG